MGGNPLTIYARAKPEQAAELTEATEPNIVRVTVTKASFGSGVAFAQKEDGSDVSVAHSVIRRDCKYVSGLKRGWVLHCEIETHPDWKRPRIKKIHSIEM
jgi:hypothetical protein